MVVAAMDRGLPHSAFAVLRSLSRFGPLSPKEISEKSKVPERTVTYALRRLMRQKLLIKIPNLEDMRQCLYSPNLETVKELIRVCGHDSLIGTQLSLILRR